MPPKKPKGSTVDSVNHDHDTHGGTGETTQPQTDIAASLQRIEKKINNTNQSINVMQEDIKKIKKSIASVKTVAEEANTVAVQAKTVAEEALTKSTGVENQIQNVNNDVEMLISELTKVRQENKQMKESIVRAEAFSRRDNLILNGIEENEPEDPFKIVYKILEEKMGLENACDNIKISRCHRLGPKRANQSRPIIFKLHYFPDKSRIWKQRTKLKDSNIWLSEDFPQAIVQRRQVLDAIRKKAISVGRKAFLSVDRLIIDDRAYTVDSLHNLPIHLRPEEVFTKRSETHTAFYSRNSPLSNYFPCKFKDENGTTFSSNEQHYQYKKAIHCGDPITARLILATDDPAECKKLGNKVTILDEKVWDDTSLEVMYHGCFAKFKQDSDLRAFLMSTNDTEILEANPYDTKWGIGLRLQDPNVFKPDCWKGTNWLGKTLKKVRDILRE